MNGIESMTASSHSSVAPKHTAFCDYTENKAKVKVAELTGVQQLYRRLYLACTVCLWTQSQSSLYSISLRVKCSAKEGGCSAGLHAQSGATQRLCTYSAMSSLNVKTLSPS